MRPLSIFDEIHEASRRNFHDKAHAIFRANSKSLSKRQIRKLLESSKIGEKIKEWILTNNSSDLSQIQLHLMVANTLRSDHHRVIELLCKLTDNDYHDMVPSTMPKTQLNMKCVTTGRNYARPRYRFTTIIDTDKVLSQKNAKLLELKYLGERKGEEGNGNHKRIDERYDFSVFASGSPRIFSHGNSHSEILYSFGYCLHHAIRMTPERKSPLLKWAMLNTEYDFDSANDQNSDVYDMDSVIEQIIVNKDIDTLRKIMTIDYRYLVSPDVSIIRDPWELHVSSLPPDMRYAVLEFASRSINSNDVEYAFNSVAEFGYADIVRSLLRDGIDPSYAESQPLRLAAHYGHSEVVKILLDVETTDPTGDNHDAFFSACSEGHAEIIEMLLNCPEVDPLFKNGLYLEMAHPDVIKVLKSDKRVDDWFRAKK